LLHPQPAGGEETLSIKPLKEKSALEPSQPYGESAQDFPSSRTLMATTWQKGVTLEP
jgi:hypothetical protein